MQILEARHTVTTDDVVVIESGINDILVGCCYSAILK